MRNNNEVEVWYEVVIDHPHAAEPNKYDTEKKALAAYEDLKSRFHNQDVYCYRYSRTTIAKNLGHDEGAWRQQPDN